MIFVICFKYCLAIIKYINISQYRMSLLMTSFQIGIILRLLLFYIDIILLNYSFLKLFNIYYIRKMIKRWFCRIFFRIISKRSHLICLVHFKLLKLSSRFFSFFVFWKQKIIKIYILILLHLTVINYIYFV